MILLDAIEAAVDFLTLRSLLKKKPRGIERAMAETYAQSDESKKVDELARVASSEPTTLLPSSTMNPAVRQGRFNR